MTASAVPLDSPAPQAREGVRPDPRSDANRIKLSWLIRLQWYAIVGQSLTILGAVAVLRISLPPGPLFALVGLAALGNVVLGMVLRRAPHLPESVIAVAMVFHS